MCTNAAYVDLPAFSLSLFQRQASLLLVHDASLLLLPRCKRAGARAGGVASSCLSATISVLRP